MAGESDSSRRRWTEEDEQWARISRHRDLGIPLNYDEATGTCEGEEVCGEEAWMRRPTPEGQMRTRYPRIFDPAKMDFEKSRYLARDFYIPNSTVKSAENQIVLNVDEDQLESMDLPKPDFF